MVLVEISGNATKKITLVSPPEYVRRRIRMSKEVYVDMNGNIFCDGQLLNLDYNIDRKIIKSSTHIDTTNIAREVYIYESIMNDPNQPRVVLVSTLNKDRVAVVSASAGMMNQLRNAGTRIEIDSANRLYINGTLQDVAAIQMMRNELGILNNNSEFYRLQFVRMEGDDVILRKVGAKSIIRLEDITDVNLIRSLQDANNVITSNGTLVFINGVNIFENAESIRATRRLITNRFMEKRHC